jgi:hypothetical protein
MTSFKIILILIFYFAFVLYCHSQNNLLLNGNMENYSSCPINGGEIEKCMNWHGNSVEYFHSCSPGLGLSTPQNGIGFQYPHSGEAYGGMYFMRGGFQNNREIATAHLVQPTSKKGFYCGGYSICRVEYCNKATNGFGIFVSADSLPTTLIPNQTVGVEYVLPVPAQFTSSISPVADTMNWTLIEGAFELEAGLKYFHIGCFKDSTEISVINAPYASIALGGMSYYYFDDAYLYELNKLPTAQNHAYNCAAQTVTLRADTGFNFRWYYLPDTVNVLSTADTFVVDASTAKHVLLRATLCSTEFTDTVFVPKLDCTGLENNALAQGAALFPNPAGNVATFSLQGMPPPGTQLHLTDLNGRELRSFAVTGKTTEMDVSTLANGVYFVSYKYKENVIWKGKICKFGD